MRVVFLASASRGLRWFRRYYADVFPEGAKRSRVAFEAMKRVLVHNPQAGQPIEGTSSRIWRLPRTPFAVIYRLRDDRVEVLAIYDQRSDSAVTAPRDHEG